MPFPNWVDANVVDGLLDAVAALESIASGNALDATSSANFSLDVATGPASSASVAAITAPVQGLSQAFVAFYQMVPVLVSSASGIDPSVVSCLYALAHGVTQAMAPADAVAAFAAAADATPDVVPPTSGSANLMQDALNQQIVGRLTRAVMLAGYAEAVCAADYQDRPVAITARADCVERFEREIYLCAGAVDAGFARGLMATRDACVAYLSEAIINSQPVMTVTAPISLPSLALAWRLYQDPTRASDLIARNDVPHASFFPETFEALAA